MASGQDITWYQNKKHINKKTSVEKRAATYQYWTSHMSRFHMAWRRAATMTVYFQFRSDATSGQYYFRSALLPVSRSSATAAAGPDRQTLKSRMTRGEGCGEWGDLCREIRGCFDTPRVRPPLPVPATGNWCSPCCCCCCCCCSYQCLQGCW